MTLKEEQVFSPEEIREDRDKRIEMLEEAKAIIRELLERNDPESVYKIEEYAEAKYFEYFQQDNDNETYND